MLKTDALQGILASISVVMGTICSFCFGDVDVFLTTLITMLVIDYITGLIAAYMNNELSSRTGLKGIIKKVLRLIIVAAAVQVDRITDTNGYIRNTVILFFITNEGISILENSGKCGVPIPKKFLDVLEQLRENNNKDDSDKEPKEDDAFIDTNDYSEENDEDYE